MSRSSAWLLSALVALSLAGCSPPHIEARSGDLPDGREPQGGLTQAGSGTDAGIAAFASQDQMYEALADVLAGTLTSGARAYSLDVQEQTAGEADRRAYAALHSYPQLHALAARASVDTAASDGKTVRRVQVDVRPLGTEGRCRVVVRSWLLEDGGGLVLETRRGVAWVDAESGKTRFAWTGPPQLP